MALVSVSQRAWDAMERRKKKAQSFAYDLLRWRTNWVPVSRGGKVPDGTPRSQPISIPTHLTSALQVAVRLILDEGIANRARRHAVAGAALRAGVAAMGLTMFPDPTIASNTVSCIRTPKDIEPTLGALELALRDLGGKCEPGAGVAAAQGAFANGGAA
jgi:aspartate aminotransferase-like enzyme